MTNPARKFKFFITAGEASGDALGVALMAALSERSKGQIEFYGIGGDLMQRAGLKTLFPANELAVMGFVELLPHLSRLLRRLRQTAAAVRVWQPDVVITIDAPGFNKRLAKMIGRGTTKLIHYVAPSVWAWRPGRAKTMARLFDHVLCLLPFEPPYFTRHGMRADFVGHPIVTSDWDKGDGPAFRRTHNLPQEAPLLCLLPGSRQQEIKRLLPLFLEVFGRLQRQIPELRAVLPTLPHLVPWLAANFSIPSGVVIQSDYAGKKDALAASLAALAASGTVSLELNRAKLPGVIAYRTSALSAFLARRLVKLRYFTLCNILLQQPAMPEFFQEQANADNLTAALHHLLTDKDARQAQINLTQAAMQQLIPPGGDPARAAAEAILGLLPKS